MKVKVTQYHIDNGIPCSTDSCPIAQAINELDDKDYPKDAEGGVSVVGGEVSFDYKDFTYDIPLPDIARDFIVKFDSDENVAPFEFELDFEKGRKCYDSDIQHG